MSAALAEPIVAAVAHELELPAPGVRATLELLDQGNTVPFVARYRKEATGGLDEVQIRAVQERGEARAALEKRRKAVLASLEERGHLDATLQRKVLACATRAELEDLYLPYRPKRRTRASIARELGLRPLAERILEQPPRGQPEHEAEAFVDPERGLADAAAVLTRARDIVAEAVSERAPLRARVRTSYRDHGLLRVAVADEEHAEANKYEQYFDFAEPLARLPSHRALAIRRGERAGVLRSTIEVDNERLVGWLVRAMGHRPGSPFARQLELAVADGFKRLLAPSIDNEVRGALKERADRTAVDVFANNLGGLLLAPPLGGHAVLGVDPGLRTGCKCTAVDSTGRLLEQATIFPHGSAARREQAARKACQLVRSHKLGYVAVGNGTAGRETERFLRDALRADGLAEVVVVTVNEAGASVYSASDLARAELPGLDVSLRGAVSIARRLQDPLAELVKVEPKALGVGQYQHDVDAKLLARKLDEVVESCVNRVGVELNTASPALLTRVAGVGPALAAKIVAHRDAQGPFPSRRALLKVSGLGRRTFEQAAGFLRIRGAAHPLDGSAVHPERYKLVQQMAKDLGVTLAALVGDQALVERIDLRRWVQGDVGLPTLEDIAAELVRPGRDPRKAFEPPRFKDDVNSIDDLRPGMILEGVVTNVTAFGAFVDIGVHRDGLVHVSQLADRFVRDPHAVAHPGQRMQVRVVDVDLRRKRISLSARLDPGGDTRSEPRQGRGADSEPSRPERPARAATASGRGERRGRDQRGPKGRGQRERGQRERGQRERGRRPERGGEPERGAGGADERLSHNPFAALLDRRKR